VLVAPAGVTSRMGLAIDREQFEDADYQQFGVRLQSSLRALELVLARGGFGEGPPSIGAELELNLVDAQGRPLPLNRAVLAETIDPRVTLELDRFNLEINSRPVPLGGRPLSALRDELDSALAATQRAAAAHGGRVVAIGVLPTLRESDLQASLLTDLPRYRALSASLRRLRCAPFEVKIEGDDELTIACDDMTLEGANTSFQLHLRVSPNDFARTYNAAQIATAPALAIGANSPLFLGQRLWDETRIALFRQSVDDRTGGALDEWKPARVSFGHGWVRRGALELFAESVALHEPLLPVVGPQDPLEVARAGGVPGLLELRLHQGTVWRWNRAVYDDSAGGHLRIELRALPAGPTLDDMIASAAFLLGLVLGLAPEADRLVNQMTFGQARRNFYAAAQRGLDAELLWPSDVAPSPRPVPARELVLGLLPVARRGLVDNGVDPAEAEGALAIVADRVDRGITGARWQRRTLDALRKSRAREGSLALLLERYLAGAATGRPVHEWPIEG
jgi:gamma-glutamyl:cysteine ligase YbdK (ATP-grasp superfamily)